MSEVVTPALLREWQLSGPGTDKDSRGHVLVLGGAASTPGAVLLAAESTLRAGAGKLAVATVRSVAAALGVALPEAMVTGLDEDDRGTIATSAADELVEQAEPVDALLVGPGFTDPQGAEQLLTALLPRVSVPVVLDALGTAYLTHHRDGLHHLDGRAVVTANPTELARIVDCDESETSEDPHRAAEELARSARVVVLAGASTKHVVAPDGRSWVVEGGTSGLGVSGSGDVQAGIVAGLLAREGDPAQAAVWGAYLHARVGERLAGSVGPVGFLARELPAAVPAVLKELA